MKYYKDNIGQVYAYKPDGSQDEFIGDKIAMTIEEVNEHRNPTKTVEQIKEEISAAISTMLNDKAREFRYDNMLSARSYAGFANTFQPEAQALAVWAASCWAKVGEIETEVVSSTRAMPTVEEVILEMPSFVV